MIYQFDQLTLDTDQYRLQLAGAPVPVEPLVFDLLVYLVENRHRVVTRDELLENLWTGKVVTDSALAARLKDARKAVGDSGTRQSIIKTVHGRGYQFVAEVLEAEEKPPLAQTDPEAAIETGSASGKPSIAVLPFRNLSSDTGQDYFCDGIVEDLISNLCRFRELFVIHSHSTFVHREDDIDIRFIARELGADYVAKGSIRRAGNQVKISAQLIEAAMGKTIWSERIVRNYEDLFSLEEEVASKIASSLVNLIEEESDARATRKHPQNMTAFDCVMRARHDSASFDETRNRSARKLLKQAIELDPGYASAYAYLAKSYCYEAYTQWCRSRQETIEKAVRFARRAVELDDFDSDAHEIIGLAYLYQKKFALSEIHLDRAVQCNPNAYSGFCTKSWLFALTGRNAEVSSCGTTALQLNPLAPDSCLLAFTMSHYTEGRFEEALEVLARFQEPNANSEAWRAACLAQLGRDEEARAAAANAIEWGGSFIREEDWLHFWPFQDERDLEYFVDGLKKSGIL